MKTKSSSTRPSTSLRTPRRTSLPDRLSALAQRVGFRLPASVAGLLLVAACAAPNLSKEVQDETRDSLKSPAAPPSVALTSFSEGLRCVDLQLLDFSVKNISILVEDLDDQTKKVPAGTKDMLISAFQEATKRSRAVRLVAFGNDARNASTFLDRAQRQTQYQNVPDFGIRGSVSQFDDNVVKKSADAGFSLGELFAAGMALSSSSKVLGVDLTVMRLEDFSVVPGVSSKNAIVILQQGSGSDASSTIRKFNITYQSSTTRSEGTAIALRNLIELATIELLGKLVKIPYWRCLGAKDNDPDAKSEVSDWFEGMVQSENQAELFSYFQYHLSRLGLYEGENNGTPSKELADAIRKYRVVLGMTNTSDLNAELFGMHLGANRSTVRGKVETLLAEAAAAKAAAEAAAPKSADAAPASAPSSAATIAAKAPAPGSGGAAVAPQATLVATATQAGAQQPGGQSAGQAATGQTATGQAAASPAGGAIDLKFLALKSQPANGAEADVKIAANSEATLYCFMKDAAGAVIRLLPNAGAKQIRLTPGQTLTLRGEPPQAQWRLYVNDKGLKETVACFASNENLVSRLPKLLQGPDFQALAGVTSIEVIREAIRTAAGARFGEAWLTLGTR
jgi:ribosomal protein L13E